MPESEQIELKEAIKPYIETMQAEESSRNGRYFHVVQLGYLKMGIGSALDMKYLVRIDGETTEPLDDIVLEMKEVRDLSGIPCITLSSSGDPFRVLVGQARIAYTPFNHLGYFLFRGKNFWVHSWVDNYKEIDISKSLRRVEQLREIVRDVGVQLGRGHVKHIAAPFDLQLRRQQSQIMAEHAQRLIETCATIEKQVIAAWETFKNAD